MWRNRVEETGTNLLDNFWALTTFPGSSRPGTGLPCISFLCLPLLNYIDITQWGCVFGLPENLSDSSGCSAGVLCGWYKGQRKALNEVGKMPKLPVNDNLKANPSGTHIQRWNYNSFLPLYRTASRTDVLARPKTFALSILHCNINTYHIIHSWRCLRHFVRGDICGFSHSVVLSLTHCQCKKDSKMMPGTVLC